MTIPSYAEGVPHLSTLQMLEVDRLMVEEYGIELIQMMENAGRNLAHMARVRFLDGDPRGKTVVILAGTGGNGGGALVCGRRLSNWGAEVHVALTKPDDRFTEVPGHQLGILRRMGLQVVQAGKIDGLTEDGAPDLIVDGIIGYSLSGAPEGGAANLIHWANGCGVPILALDAPSGLDVTTGTAFDPAIRATATLTLALPKLGLRAVDVEENVGELYLADISVPPSLYAEASLDLRVDHLFAESDIVRLQ
jgi:NAD(P)H-hydrate epimerase